MSVKASAHRKHTYTLGRYKLLNFDYSFNFAVLVVIKNTNPLLQLKLVAHAHFALKKWMDPASKLAKIHLSCGKVS